MLRPEDTFILRPEGDGEDKPALEYKARSAAYWIDYARRYREIMQAKTDDYLAGLAALVSEGLVGWSGIGHTFAAATLADVMTPTDLMVIARLLPLAATLSDTDRKKSELQSLSSTAPSAGNVGPVTV